MNNLSRFSSRKINQNKSRFPSSHVSLCISLAAISTRLIGSVFYYFTRLIHNLFVFYYFFPNNSASQLSRLYLLPSVTFLSYLFPSLHVCKTHLPSPLDLNSTVWLLSTESSTTFLKVQWWLLLILFTFTCSWSNNTVQKFHPSGNITFPCLLWRLSQIFNSHIHFLVSPFSLFPVHFKLDIYKLSRLSDPGSSIRFSYLCCLIHIGYLNILQYYPSTMTIE